MSTSFGAQPSRSISKSAFLSSLATLVVEAQLASRRRVRDSRDRIGAQEDRVREQEDRAREADETARERDRAARAIQLQARALRAGALVWLAPTPPSTGDFYS